MRIISEFHDYYDSIQAMGQDQSVVYVRKPEEVFYKSFKDWPFPQFGQLSIWSRNVLWSPVTCQVIVGFCGRIYPVLLLGGYTPRNKEPKGAACFNIGDIDRYAESQLKPAGLEEYRYKLPKKRWKLPRMRYCSPYARRENFEAYFIKCAEVKTNYEQIFIEHRCPIFLASRQPISKYDAERYGDKSKIVYNARLGDVEFFRVFDPMQAFQELSMYFGNIAQPNRPIPIVSDRDLAAAKGFDKHSFRKEPNKSHD